MSGDDQQRGEQATPHKLEQARKRGAVPKGADLNAFFALLALLGVLYWAGAQLFAGGLRLARAAFGVSWSRMASADPLAWPLFLFFEHLHLWAGLFALLMACAVLACLLQTGPVFSFAPLKPDFKRLDFVEGAKRFLTAKVLVDALRAALKTILLGLALGWFLRHSTPVLLGLPASEVRTLAGTVLKLVLQLLAVCLAALVPVVVLDLVTSKHEFRKRMRMSRREVQEEHKQREGDPRIRARQKSLQKEARKRSASLRRVAQAKVLVTNPTRLAVALAYDSSRMEAPMVLAKGAGQLAGMMREMAWRHGVPIVRNRSLAAQLFRDAALDAPIPALCYGAVARILAWLHASERMRASAVPGTGRST